MRVAGFILINLFLVLINVAFAGSAFGLFSLAKWLFPSAMDEPLIVYAVSAAALAATLWFMCWSVRMFPKLIERMRNEGRGRARG